MKRYLCPPVVVPVLCVGMLAAALWMPGPVREMDLNSFGSLPVLNNGRIKPIDSIARNSLLIIRGKQTLVRDRDRMSAVEWFLDLSTRIKRADNYKIFVINDPDVLGLLGKKQTKTKYYSYRDLGSHHEVIHLQALRVSKIDAKRRNRFQSAIVNLDNRLTLYQRLKFSLRINDATEGKAEVAAYEIAIIAGKEAFARHQISGGKDFNVALGRLGIFFRRYRFLAGVAYFKAVPPPPGAPADAWLNIGEALLNSMRDGTVPSAAKYYAEILDAYKAGDAKVFNRATADYRDELALSVPGTLGNAGAETRFNDFAPFYQGIVLYLIAFLLVCGSWLYRPEMMRLTAYRVLLVAVAVHTFGLFARMWLQGRPPVTNLYSSAIFVGWGSVLLGIILERIHRRGFAALVASAVGFCTLIIAHHLASSGDTLEMMQAVLDSNYWLGTHVVVITIGYSSTFLAGTLGIVTIFRRFAGRLDKDSAQALAQMTYGIVCFSLLFSFVGTILGGIWADQSWGRFWGWDPKENGALLIVLWHTVVLHARLGGYIRERGIAAMAVFGSIICSLSWFGVNMLGIGLHSYGFMDKAFWWLSAFIFSQLFVIGLAFLPPGTLSRLKWASEKRSAKAA